jgi:circadian clock protein KaiC
MAHSNQIREFILTDLGVELVDVYVGPEGVLAGSARITQEAKEKADQLLHQQEIDRKRYELERKHKALESQIALLQVEFEAEEAEALKVIGLNEARIKRSSQDKREMAESRKADTDLKITDTNRKINK